MILKNCILLKVKKQDIYPKDLDEHLQITETEAVIDLGALLERTAG